MEGKTVVLSVLIMSLVMAQIEVDAEGCCPSTTARDIYNACRVFAGYSTSRCASMSGCEDMNGNCPPGYTNDILENPGDAVNEYCKLGCASSVCGALISTLKNSDPSENMNGVVVQCTKACSTFCTKSSINAVKTA